MTKIAYFVSSDMSSIYHDTLIRHCIIATQRHSVTTAALLLIAKTSSMQATHAIKKQTQQLNATIIPCCCQFCQRLTKLFSYSFSPITDCTQSSDFSTFTHRDATVSQQSGWINTPLTQGNSCTTLHIAHYTCKVQLFPNGRTYLLEVGYFPRCPCLIQACR